MRSVSNTEQLEQIRDIICGYQRLPFSGDIVPGSVLEATLAHARGAERLGTYDFIDVIKRNTRIGWQVKSTLARTPITWKRAKIENQAHLIEASQLGALGLQQLGDAIIEFCNAAVAKDFRTYDIDEIHYARLIIHKNGRAVYFERELVTRRNPVLFKASDFEWRWSVQRMNYSKEQLPALHGFHKETGAKWWAWHGKGENQLHFSGERTWWPDETYVPSIRFNLPQEHFSLVELLALLDNTNHR